MRVLVDTSAWVDYFNGADTPERHALRQLLAAEAVAVCGLVVAEVLQGIRGVQDAQRIEGMMRRLPYLETRGFEAHSRAAWLFRELRARGITVRSTVDCLIATIAESHAHPLLVRDRDLKTIATSGLLTLQLWEVGGGSGR